MREYAASQLEDAVARLYVDACLHLPEWVKERLYTFGNPYIIENFEKNGIIPLCQDTGMAVVYLEIGQDAHITGSILDAVNAYCTVGEIADAMRESLGEYEQPAFF